MVSLEPWLLMLDAIIIDVNAICPGGHEERNLKLAQERAEYMNKPFDEVEFHNKFRQPNRKRILAGRWRAGEDYGDQGSGTEETASLTLFLSLDDSASRQSKTSIMTGEPCGS